MSFDVPCLVPFVGVYGRKGFEGRLKNQTELMTFIYKLLFDWVSIRVDFDEIEWYSIWCKDL